MDTGQGVVPRLIPFTETAAPSGWIGVKRNCIFCASKNGSAGHSRKRCKCKGSNEYFFHKHNFDC